MEKKEKTNRGKILHGIHIKDTKVLNLGGERHPQGERKEKNKKKIWFWQVKIPQLRNQVLHLLKQ